MSHALFGEVVFMTNARTSRKTPSQQAILRAIASSTAIETGQSIEQLERKLKSKTGKFRHVALAN